MKKAFKLEVILTFIIKHSCTNDKSAIMDLAKFLYGNEYIMELTNEEMNYIKDHLLRIHPKLKDVKYSFCTIKSFQKWIVEQKVTFGEELEISPFGYSLVGAKAL